ncbi:MAG: signal peptidase I [Cephaloticoccus sp.]|nr:signal peptidase I [Cephaloticoccus sp.]MCF7760790.1 signal peptidase I [Cephaloticoccus sp.]
MFGIFDSPERKMRANAIQWLELADKVWHYRRDCLSAAELTELQAQTQSLRRLVHEKADRMKLKLAVESLEGNLRSLGGTHYPKSSLVENVEFFLVAAIVILGFRAFFIQPFKIPTNSMWPSYYGMTAENFPPEVKAPNLAGEAIRFLAFGAKRREITAARAGEVSADFFETGELAYTVKAGRTWLVLPTTVREYTFYVNGEPSHVTVPLDFHEVDRVMRETFFKTNEAFVDYLQRSQRDGIEFKRGLLQTTAGSDHRTRVVRVPLNRTVQKGDILLRFDVLTGDQLFVDRMSYHFMAPSVGQGFVFRTGKIDSVYMRDRNTGRQIDQYYIKRLVGTPGDTLEIKDYTLFRNGQPITGAAAFANNAQRVDNYVGYRNELSLAAGQTMTVTADHFLALGDNSANSQDGRYWGFVPASEVVGRPIFIYYPFTRRWGPAR